MRTSVLWISVVLAGCGQGVLELGSEALPGIEIGDEEVFYLEDQVGPVVLDAREQFEHIEFHASLSDTEIRVLDADGVVVADWAHLSSFVDDSDPVAYEGTLNLPQAADRIELRLRTPVDFGRFAVGPGHVDGHDPEEGPVNADGGGVSVQRAHAGRWIPPAHVVNVGNQQYLPYSGAPSRCSGTMKPGTRALADHLVRSFVGGRSYGGYNCRANTADPSSLSVHASGRAIDLFVPLHGTQADNDLGDPIANYLVQNANRLGIEYIVWDRTSWGAHRAAPKHRYYSGPHPHHDHLHIELAPWAANNGTAFGHSPRGHLDAANCGGISGWSQDQDVPHQATDVYVSIGGPVFTPGAHGAWTLANERRGDLCAAIGSCNHGWYTKVPHGVMDGVEREVYAYGADKTGDNNAQLVGVRRIRCSPPTLPYSGAQAIKRHIPNPETFARWGFQWNDVIRVSDAKLNSYATGPALGAAPRLRRHNGSAGVFVVEFGKKRHVPNPRALRAWGFNRNTLRDVDLSGHTTARALEARPYLVRGSGNAIYLLWPK